MASVLIRTSGIGTDADVKLTAKLDWLEGGGVANFYLYFNDFAFVFVKYQSCIMQTCSDDAAYIECNFFSTDNRIQHYIVYTCSILHTTYYNVVLLHIVTTYT